MAITINGSGTVTGISVGGLPDGIVDDGTLATDAVTNVKIADNAVDLAEMASGTDGQIITYDASGNPTAVGPGTDGQVLTSTGAGSPPAFEAVAAGLTETVLYYNASGTQGNITLSSSMAGYSYLHITVGRSSQGVMFSMLVPIWYVLSNKTISFYGYNSEHIYINRTSDTAFNNGSYSNLYVYKIVGID